MYYDRIDIREGIDIAKRNNNKEFMIFHYCFFNNEFNFQDYVCNDCRDLAMLIVNISDIAMIIAVNVDYRCIIHNISKSEPINLLKKPWYQRLLVTVTKCDKSILEHSVTLNFVLEYYRNQERCNKAVEKYSHV